MLPTVLRPEIAPVLSPACKMSTCQCTKSYLSQTSAAGTAPPDQLQPGWISEIKKEQQQQFVILSSVIITVIMKYIWMLQRRKFGHLCLAIVY